ncbi:MAG: M1 family metallopeptidase [bacterium]|nr:M1 family metallopeptidase [bacterium]
MKKTIRLSELVKPSHYQLDLFIDLEKFVFTANELINFQLIKSCKLLKFHCTDLKIKNVKLKMKNIELKSKKLSFNEDEQIVIFDFGTKLQAGNYQLRLSFNARLKEKLQGLYLSKYIANNKEKYIATTQFEATSAREAFICIDEPSAKATFDVSITHNKNLMAISNTNIIKSEKLDRNIIKDYFATTPKMSTYLLAFAIGEFEQISTKTKEGIEVRVLATPGKSQLGRFALDTSTKVLTFYNEYFAIPYPLSKLDMIAIPDFAFGAMENWGLVTYRETGILVDEKNTSLMSKQYVAIIIAHELAHQWFGNLVTMDWWTDLWLNEGFASWIEYLAVDHLYPEWQVWSQFVANDYNSARKLDSLANTHPIEIEVNHPGEISEIFDTISYQKGASIIRMLYEYLGENKFRKGLVSYLKKYAYKNAKTIDLWAELEDVSKKPVKKIMSKWTKTSGLPLVSIDESKVKQQRFFVNPKQAEVYQTWPIPLNITTDKKGLNFLINKKQDKFVNLAKFSWIKPNSGQSTFCFFKYTPEIIDKLKESINKLDVLDRWGILSDSLMISKAGFLPIYDLLQLLESYQNESDYIVWMGITDIINDLFRTFDDEKIRTKLKVFTDYLIMPALSRIGLKEKVKEDHFSKLLRPLLISLAVTSDNKKIIDYAKKQFGNHLHGKLIEPTLRSVIFTAVAKTGNKKDYNNLFKLYKASDLQEEKRRIFAALTQFKQAKLINKTLDFILTDNIRVQDRIIHLIDIMSNRHAKIIVWQFIKKNWQKIVEIYGKQSLILSYIPQGLGNNFADHKAAKEVEKFFKKNMTENIKRSVAQAVEKIEFYADWKIRNETNFVDFLDRQQN